jgi:DnaJ like chaperone protein
MAVYGHTNSLRQMLLVYLIVMAISDGRLDGAEVPQNSARGISGMTSLSLATAGHGSESDVLRGWHGCFAHRSEDAYKALGVTKESTDQEIKRGIES